MSPDLHGRIEDQIAEGDTVVTRTTLTGTNTASYVGRPPTNKAVTMTGITIDRIEGGKIVESWGEFDQLGMLQQLGVIPEPGSANYIKGAKNKVLLAGCEVSPFVSTHSHR